MKSTTPVAYKNPSLRRETTRMRSSYTQEGQVRLTLVSKIGKMR